MRVHLAEFRRGFVKLKLGLPIALRDRRDDSWNRPPLNNRKPRARKAGYSSNRDHQQYQGAETYQPEFFIIIFIAHA